MPIVRTTLQPDRAIEVSSAELLDLQRQGLLVEPDPVPAPAVRAASAKTPTAAKAKES